MTTVTEVVTGALRLLEVNVSESAIEPVEAVDGLTALNDMMNELSLEGIDVGYEAIDAVEEEVFVTPGAIGPIKALLAIYIAPEYGRVVTAALFARAINGKRTLLSSIPLNSLEFPDTLPIGSGNENNTVVADGDVGGNFGNSRFYPTNTFPKCG